MLTISIQANIEPILRRFAALPAQIDAALTAGVEELTEMAHGQIERTLPKVSGDMHGNIVTRFHGTAVTGVFEGRVVGDIAGRVMETGRAAGHWTPVSVIREWAAAKGGIGTEPEDIAKIIFAMRRDGSPKRRRGGSVSPYHAFQRAGQEVRRQAMGVFRKHLAASGAMAAGGRRRR